MIQKPVLRKYKGTIPHHRPIYLLVYNEATNDDRSNHIYNIVQTAFKKIKWLRPSCLQGRNDCRVQSIDDRMCLILSSVGNLQTFYPTVRYQLP